MNRYRALKLEMLATDPHCHWCKVEVIDYVPKEYESAPHNMATVDHLVNRRYRKKGEVVEKVLACHKCNSKKDTEDSKWMNPEWIRVHQDAKRVS